MEEVFFSYRISLYGKNEEVVGIAMGEILRVLIVQSKGGIDHIRCATDRGFLYVFHVPQEWKETVEKILSAYEKVR